MNKIHLTRQNNTKFPSDVEILRLLVSNFSKGLVLMEGQRDSLVIWMADGSDIRCSAVLLRKTAAVFFLVALGKYKLCQELLLAVQRCGTTQLTRTKLNINISDDGVLQ